jgi:prevent-host-death family protein
MSNPETTDATSTPSVSTDAAAPANPAPVPTPAPADAAPTSGSTPAPSDFRETGSTTATDLRRELSDVLKYVEKDGLNTVAITRHGKVVAAVVGGTEFKLLQRLKESAKSLAPKLGMSVDALLDKLASFEPPLAVMASDAQRTAVEAALKEIPASNAELAPTVPSEGSTFPQEPKSPVVNASKGGFTPPTGPAVPQPATFNDAVYKESLAMGLSDAEARNDGELAAQSSAGAAPAFES